MKLSEEFITNYKLYAFMTGENEGFLMYIEKRVSKEDKLLW